jgi:threonine/homoserine/homoserine lactone efflux protein
VIPVEVAISFFAVAVLLALAPGPDNIFVLTQAAVNGKTAGLFVTFGLCSGLIIHTAAVAFGVAALFQASAIAFNAVKIAGAVYLLYLAWGAFRAGAEKISSSGELALSLRALYARGFIMNVTNPKVTIFFLAFLPQFADPERGSMVIQMMMLGGLMMIATILVFGSIALLAGTLGDKFASSERAQIILNRIAGTIFAALALKLITAER